MRSIKWSEGLKSVYLHDRLSQSDVNKKFVIVTNNIYLHFDCDMIYGYLCCLWNCVVFKVSISSSAGLIYHFDSSSSRASSLLYEVRCGDSLGNSLKYGFSFANLFFRFLTKRRNSSFLKS